MDRQILRFQNRDIFTRELISLSVQELADIFPLPIRENSYFQLFLAMDGRQEIVGDLGGIPEMLIHEGLAYLNAWGPDCSRVHDIFDLAIGHVGFETGNEKTIMTTWAEQDTLEAALWFSIFCAFSAHEYVGKCTTTYFVSVANHEWSKQISNALTGIEALSHRIVG